MKLMSIPPMEAPGKSYSQYDIKWNLKSKVLNSMETQQYLITWNLNFSTHQMETQVETVSNSSPTFGAKPLG